jgi:hypothetical protein
VNCHVERVEGFSAQEGRSALARRRTEYTEKYLHDPRRTRRRPTNAQHIRNRFGWNVVPEYEQTIELVWCVPDSGNTKRTGIYVGPKTRDQSPVFTFTY